MTKEDVIRMARRAGAVFPGDGSYHTFERIIDLEHFAFLVAEAEREACAKVCDGWDFLPGGHEPSPQQLVKNITSTIANHIRARSQP
jgi:hypothetical protein